MIAAQSKDSYRCNLKPTSKNLLKFILSPDRSSNKYNISLVVLSYDFEAQ